MHDMIHLNLARMSEDGQELKYIKEAFDTNWVAPLGPNVNAFEHELEDFVNHNDDSRTLDRKVVCLNSGTSAIHLALIACGVGPGDEVCVQSFTFCASSNPIVYLGAKPVFIGSEAETWNMDPELLELAILDRKEKTGKYPKAIIPVSLYGMPYQIDRIMTIADKYGIPVVEDSAEGMGTRFNGQALGTFGRFGVLSFNGNKMITTSGGGALICNSSKKSQKVSEVSEGGLETLKQIETIETATEAAQNVMWYATQARDAYPYYQHTAIGYNYRMSNVCAGIGRGQMTVLDDHIAHHKHVQALYEELLADVKGFHIHKAPALKGKDGEGLLYDSNFWLCSVIIDPDVRIHGQENAYKKGVTRAIGGAAGVIRQTGNAVTDCQPNDNVEALREFLHTKNIDSRPLWKPMHLQPVYSQGASLASSAEGAFDFWRKVKSNSQNADVRIIEGLRMAVYTRGVEERLFKVGICLPSGPWVTDDVEYIVECIKEGLVV